MTLSPRLLKFVGLSYLVKTILLALACVLMPDLPHRARTLLGDLLPQKHAVVRR